ncbi:MAG: tetratricopeptide repeat protein [Spirochaetaceae bacterium]|nr:MAG: tetratricopeptide repeat protein [Spirochaetaceae bacterium]
MTSDSSVTAAMEIARKLEAALKLYNEYLHFDLDRLALPLRVRIFSDKKDYDSYLNRLISETRSDFVYISYSDPGRSELVGFQREESDFNPSLLHYGFIQFLSAFVPAAPLWIEEGMATFLEYAQYDPMTESFSWKANYAWLESLKNLLASEEIMGELTLGDLLLITKEQAQARIEIFYPSAWGLVHFLHQSPERKHNRILWESLAVLAEGSTLGANSRNVLEKAFRWVDLVELQSSFESYIASLMTFNDLVRLGVDQYGMEDFSTARSSFEEALKLRSDNYIPYYYLGLIAYQEKAYEVAHSFYNRAQELGIDAALIHYALGVNFFADQRYDQAREYLLKAKELDADSYREKAESLLQRIEVMQ